MSDNKYARGLAHAIKETRISLLDEFTNATLRASMRSF